MSQLKLGDITVDIIQKNIKHMHLSVHPPTGRVRISAPIRLSMDTIRVYAISKLSWIKKHQTRFRNQPREAARDYISNESHFYNGKRYLLKVIEHNAPPKVILKHDIIELYTRQKTNKTKRRKILESWYRDKLKLVLPGLINKWEIKMGLSVNQFGIKRMKTRWGTCNSKAKRIWLNLELAKKPIYCVEYIIVHEMVHFLVRHHNDIFKSYMDKFLPQWRLLKQELNSQITAHYVE
jgi:predicted metal-dependent hydrolase